MDEQFDVKGFEKTLNEVNDGLKKSAEEKGAIAAQIQETNNKLNEQSTQFSETKSSVEKIQRQLDALDARVQEGRAGEQKAAESVADKIVNNEEVKKFVTEEGWRTKKGIRIAVPDGTFFPITGRKATITGGTIGGGTSGVIMPVRGDGVIRLARRTLRIRDLLSVRALTTGNSVDYVKQSVFTNAASPVAESGTKPGSDMTYTTMTATVRTIAHWFQVTTQALADVPGLREDLESQGIYGLLLKEEDEILTGSGTGQHLNGIYTQATAYNTGLTVSGDTRIDLIRRAILQVELANRQATGVVLHPTDMALIDTQKTEEGGSNKGSYLIGNPRTGVEVDTLWGRPVVSSLAMTSGTFLVGDFANGATLWDRMAATTDISLENEDNFITNEATIRFEERLALAVTMPDAFVKGSF